MWRNLLLRLLDVESQPGLDTRLSFRSTLCCPVFFFMVAPSACLGFYLRWCYSARALVPCVVVFVNTCLGV